MSYKIPCFDFLSLKGIARIFSWVVQKFPDCLDTTYWRLHIHIVSYFKYNKYTVTIPACTSLSQERSISDIIYFFATRRASLWVRHYGGIRFPPMPRSIATPISVDRRDAWTDVFLFTTPLDSARTQSAATLYTFSVDEQNGIEFL